MEAHAGSRSQTTLCATKPAGITEVWAARSQQIRTTEGHVSALVAEVWMQHRINNTPLAAEPQTGDPQELGNKV